MMHLDQQVVSRALAWLQASQPIWLCTVLSTYGSAPRGPGSLFAVLRSGESVGSLSGGCVEEDFVERVIQGEFDHGVKIIRYGEGGMAPTLPLPCGGGLDVLVEPFKPTADSCQHFEALDSILKGQSCRCREVNLSSGRSLLLSDKECIQHVERLGDQVRIRIGPSRRLIIAGLSPVAEHCIEIGLMLGHEVVVCDPRAELIEHVRLRWPQAKWLTLLPSRFIEEGGCHAATAVVALTHDPRLDDLTLMEAVRTDAYYIGAMGSIRTSARRIERLVRIGGLGGDQLHRLHAPIGLALGSKTPAEIALAVMADIIRVANGVERKSL